MDLLLVSPQVTLISKFSATPVTFQIFLLLLGKVNLYVVIQVMFTWADVRTTRLIFVWTRQVPWKDLVLISLCKDTPLILLPHLSPIFLGRRDSPFRMDTHLVPVQVAVADRHVATRISRDVGVTDEGLVFERFLLALVRTHGWMGKMDLVSLQIYCHSTVTVYCSQSRCFCDPNPANTCLFFDTTKSAAATL